MKRLCFKVGVLLGLGILLAACGGSSGGGTNSAGSPAAQTGSPGTSPGTGAITPSPGISLGPRTCPDAVKAPTHWDTIIPTQPNVSKVESVICANLKGVPTLQALVTVRTDGSGAILDVYVYDNLTSATPTQLFKLQDLAGGGARISLYNTVLTAQVDATSSVNNNKPDAGLTQDLFREFKWSDGAGTLVQVAFPGIFPDLTRYQAENDQAQVNQGQHPEKLSATQTAQALGVSLFHWNPNATATIVSGGGTHDTQAVVSLKDTAPGGTGVTITMARLEGNANGGIWIVIDVETGGLSITQPQSASTIHGSTTITGTGSAFEGVIGKMTILDHLYTPIGQASVKGATGNGSTTFSTNVTSHPTFTGGAEEGLVMLTSENNASGGVAGAVIVKVLIQQ